MSGLTVSLKVTPRARRPGVLGAGTDGVLRVAVTEPPEDGRANEAVIRLLADALGVAPSRCTLVSGAASRQKRVHVEGDPARLASSLARLPA
ncbi:DUF167 domain-containing protein [Elioraea rosea]|uniref:DUF167 domain-containing protein n=1 Tax=Elioraea rosea TaxID=2492390 RepID=UPI001186226A|nr:DUF167 domain-containing protein [Elioraea rosea]